MYIVIQPGNLVDDFVSTSWKFIAGLVRCAACEGHRVQLKEQTENNGNSRKNVIGKNLGTL